MILAIDTSSDTAGVAIAQGGTLLGETVWTGRAAHSSLLLPSIERLLATSGVGAADLHSVSVAVGPGSFSGLRVGISTAKGLAMALDIPVAGISTLDVIAWQLSPFASHVLAVLPAGRGQVYAARYEGQDRAWGRVVAPHIVALESAVSLVGQALLAGEAAGLVAAAARDSGAHPRLAQGAWNLRRPGFLAELGALYFQSGGADQCETLEPIYLRRSAAEEKRAAAQE